MRWQHQALGPRSRGSCESACRLSLGRPQSDTASKNRSYESILFDRVFSPAINAFRSLMTREICIGSTLKRDVELRRQRNERECASGERCKKKESEGQETNRSLVKGNLACCGHGLPHSTPFVGIQKTANPSQKKNLRSVRQHCF